MNLAMLKIMKTDAMKARNKDMATLYGVLIGSIETELKMKHESVSEENIVMSIIKTQHKKALQTLEYDKSDFAQLYVDILEGLLPKQMTENEMNVLLNAHNFGNMGEWMKYLKEHYPNQYDGKVASSVFKNK